MRQIDYWTFLYAISLSYLHRECNVCMRVPPTRGTRNVIIYCMASPLVTWPLFMNFSCFSSFQALMLFWTNFWSFSSALIEFLQEILYLTWKCESRYHVWGLTAPTLSQRTSAKNKKTSMQRWRWKDLMKETLSGLSPVSTKSQAPRLLGRVASLLPSCLQPRELCWSAVLPCIWYYFADSVLYLANKVHRYLSNSVHFPFRDLFTL